jgi:hypothetical protein
MENQAGGGAGGGMAAAGAVNCWRAWGAPPRRPTRARRLPPSCAPGGDGGGGGAGVDAAAQPSGAASHHAGQAHALPTVAAVEAPCPELRALWARLPPPRRQALMRVTRRELFERIRERYCSRCFGLFGARWDELKT